LKQASNSFRVLTDNGVYFCPTRYARGLPLRGDKLPVTFYRGFLPPFAPLLYHKGFDLSMGFSNFFEFFL
jgi:hypothetical protein